MNTIPKKHNSNILEEFKKTNNPLYQPTFGIALNSIIHWTKDVENNFIVVTTSAGSQYMFAGTTAKTILYSIGDKDNTKFQPMTPEEEEIHIDSILNPKPPVTEPAHSPMPVTVDSYTVGDSDHVIEDTYTKTESVTQHVQADGASGELPVDTSGASFPLYSPTGSGLQDEVTPSRVHDAVTSLPTENN
jgi:hypothetical protein